MGSSLRSLVSEAGFQATSLDSLPVTCHVSRYTLVGATRTRWVHAAGSGSQSGDPGTPG